MSGRKYIGEIVFNQNIDQYSKSKKDSLKREIYGKMTSNEYFIKNISVGGGQFLSHKNKTIKLKGNKAFVEFKETVSPFNDTYKKRNKDKSLFNWAQKNFKRSINFNKKLFLDGSLKAVKISVKKDNKTKKKTRKKQRQRGGMEGRGTKRPASPLSSDEDETDCRPKPITDDLLDEEQIGKNRGHIEQSEELDVYENKSDNDICKIKCDEETNCEIFSFDFTNNRFNIHENYKYDYVIKREEPTRIFYGPAIEGEGEVDAILCLMIEGDTAKEKYTDVIRRDNYRLLNHNCLADNLEVIAAGEVSIIGNQLTFNNVSGHYQGSLQSNTQTYIRNLVNDINHNYTCDFEDL